MAHWKLKVYLALRLLQVLGLICLGLALVGLLLMVVGSAEPRGGGAIWIDLVRSNLFLASGMFVGSLASTVILGIATERLGKRWRWELGRYR